MKYGLGLLDNKIIMYRCFVQNLEFAHLQLQKQKIEISNLNQCLLKKEKECNKLKDENQILNNKLVAQNEEYNKKNKQYEIEIDDNKKQIIKLQVIIEELEKFKKSAPKILCITKNTDNFEILGYNIEYLSHIDEELENIYEHGNYSQVWYIKKGFQHGDLIMVKRIISEEKLILARDLNDMISKVKGESK